MRRAAVVAAVGVFLQAMDARAARQPEAAQYVHTISRVATTAAWAEMHRIVHGVLPSATTVAEFSDEVGLEPQFLLATDGEDRSCCNSIARRIAT